MTEHDKRIIDKIASGHGDWFTAHLIRLILKADVTNRFKLHQVYPEEVEAVIAYQDGDSSSQSAHIIPEVVKRVAVIGSLTDVDPEEIADGMADFLQERRIDWGDVTSCIILDFLATNPFSSNN